MRHLLSFLLLSLLAVPAVRADGVQSRDGELAIVAGEFGPRVSDRRGNSVPLNIPSEVRLTSLGTLAGGWLAVGDQPVAGGRELYLRLLDPGGLKRLPTPAFKTGRMRFDPVVLTAEGAIRGLVWLEGEDRQSLTVRVSHWLGITWSRPVEIGAAEGALALDAALLEDGSWLLVWAGFDGEDDEVYYSLVFQDTVTEPVALSDNSVPDILPSVAALGDGALVAWNEYDGREYRVRATRYLEGRWSDGWSEPAGTFEPFLVRNDGRLTLLYHRYRPGGSTWELLELDEEAAVTRRSSVGAAINDRPVLRPVEGVTSLDWPGRERRAVDWTEER